MPSIRCYDAAGPLPAIESERVGRKVLAPEGGLEIPPQPFGRFADANRHALLAQGTGQPRSVALRCVDIALYFAQRYRPFRELAIGMKDGITGIFPALIEEAPGALPAIFDKPVTVAIAIGVDPLQGGREVRPQSPNGVEIAGADKIFACKHDEQRCC